ncbi:hypothetical protein [Aestuariibaculum marinum]|uniref:Uncharacterized protein n=1 Tax=Aestuariibaculum marinum TaxID=2683592 RepID=A0A8J6PNX7_9FLAO|nr:hypothetical protein [Aestuariibaculum marinum]MBD0822649.1 hypothetical protein [Aestuariibaculum marinum]
MFKLIIGKSRSKNFDKAVDLALLLGGEYDGEKIELTTNEEMKAYEKFFPLFRLNVLSWSNTRAYYDGNKVDPYRFMLFMEQRRRTFYADVLEQLDPINFRTLLTNNNSSPFLYHKREHNRFFFQGEHRSFSLVLEDKRLYDFVDRYNIGDIVYFE